MKLVADLEACLNQPGTPQERIARAYLAEHPRVAATLRAHRIGKRHAQLLTRGYKDRETTSILAAEFSVTPQHIRRRLLQTQ